MKKRFKRVGAAALSLAMIVGVMSAVTKSIEVQAANSAPVTAYWTDADGLGSFGMSSSDTTVAKIRFGLNGSDAREWAICGKDGNDLALLSTTGFGNPGTISFGTENKYSTSNFVTDINKYVSNNNNTSTYLGSTYFNNAELDKMQTVTVSTNEYDGSGYVATSVSNKKLYLPNSLNQDSCNENTIYVGKNNNIAIDVPGKLTTANGYTMNYFWLRSPYNGNGDDSIFVLCAKPCAEPNHFVDPANKGDMALSVVPAFNLNLSSVIFASAAKAASSSYNGEKANSAMTANTYTLRYASNGSEAAVVSADNTSVQVSGASSGMYLMVQNSDGVYIADASSNPSVNASSITINGVTLSDFNNCKMWLESTTDRITTAKLATSHTPGTDDTTTTSHPVCNHDYEWDVEKAPTETEDGEAVYKCTKCGDISARQPLTAYQYYILTSTNKIKNAKAGSTVKISSKYWNSFPKSFFEQLAKRRDITVKIDFPYNHKNYEITISPTQKINTSNSKAKYYGPKNLIGTYNAVEVKAK